jgi:hypothetical protein
MPLRPYVQRGWTRGEQNIRLYLDDIDAVAADLATFGTVRTIAIHPDNRRSVCDSTGEFVGREDIIGIAILLEIVPDHDRVEIEIIPSVGLMVNVGTDRHDIKVAVEGFISTLERFRPMAVGFPLWELRSTPAQLILERRATAAQTRAQRKHDLVVGLTSGIVGAILGAAATLVATMLT